uniref:Uncharacterized protein n=1 Tax=Arundo donax TaxID=35708 RepID=A0A0A9HTV9_ARUDO
MYFVFTSFWNYKVKKNNILMNILLLGISCCFNSWHL